MLTPLESPPSKLRGLKILALLPSRQAGFHYALAPLQFGKDRLNWTVSIIAQNDGFRALAAPSGLSFERPDIDSLRRAPTELTAAEVDRLNAQMRKAERAAGVPVGQLLLAAELSIGHAFAYPVFRLKENRIARAVLRDNELPMKIFMRLFARAEEFLDKSRPDLVYTLDIIDPFRSALWLAAQGRSIPCIVVRKSKLLSDRVYFTTDRLLLNVLSLYRAAALRQDGEPVSEQAHAYVQKFLEGPRIVKYQERKKAKRNSIGWPTLHWRLFKTAAARPVKFIDGSFLNGLIRYNRPLIVGALQRRHFRRFEEAELAAMKYIYFPMHKETDIPLIFQASPWFDQRFTVGLLASHLPAGYKLLVREHRSNFGYRPSGYYRDIGGLPNVVLVDAHDSQFKYLRNAELVVTENGSSGWEGLLYGRRVLTLDRSFYDGAGHMMNVEALRDLGPRLLEALSAKVREGDPSDKASELGHVIDAEYETTVPMSVDTAEDVTKMWRLFEALTELGSVDSGRRDFFQRAAAFQPVFD